MENKDIPTQSNKAIVTNQFTQKNNLSVTSLVLGIISLLLCWTIAMPIITGTIGIITGSISIAKKRDGFNISVAGIILSVISLLLGILVLLLFIIYEKKLLN